jgi:hypothetical protein
MGQACRADRFEAGQWPTAKMVNGQFGSLTAALTAAGLPARRRSARTAANLTGPEAILAARPAAHSTPPPHVGTPTGPQSI